MATTDRQQTGIQGPRRAAVGPVATVSGQSVAGCRTGPSVGAMNQASTSKWFDGHLDLACLALDGRDLCAALEDAQGPPQPASITLPALREGRVKACFGTVFTAPGLEGPCGYASSDDLDAAFSAGSDQIECYRRLAQRREITLGRSADDLDTEGSAQPVVFLLMEGADPIRDPIELGWWHEQGLRAVGLAWSRGTRYAGGNGSGGGLTSQGRAIVRALDDIGIIHDLSHLSERGAHDVLDMSTGPVMASHSNCRSLVDGSNERHLSDAVVRRIVERGGMIGLNLFSRFLVADGDRRRATISEAIAHVHHICDLAGNRNHVGLGSDLDGGFGADRIPEGIHRPADLDRLLEPLAGAGWSQDDLDAFAWGNWERFLRTSLG